MHAAVEVWHSYDAEGGEEAEGCADEDEDAGEGDHRGPSLFSR